MNVFVVGGNASIEKLFEHLGHTVVYEITKSDMLCFTGGEDVSPIFYGDKAHRTTGNNPIRDREESYIWGYGVQHGKAMVGICRGAQFLNVMSGGRMYQHVGRHCEDHMLEDVRTGEKLKVSSTHHQMVMPGPGAVLVATAAQHGPREWFDGDVPRNDVSDEDIEVVYYEKSKCLCFQPHPEFSINGEYPEMKEYFSNLLKEFFS